MRKHKKIIETGKGDFANEVNLLNELAKHLRSKRMKTGSFEFFSPEVEFQLDESGYPSNILKKEMKESNMLVEEFMLLANKTIAERIFSEVMSRLFIESTITLMRKKFQSSHGL